MNQNVFHERGEKNKALELPNRDKLQKGLEGLKELPGKGLHKTP